MGSGVRHVLMLHSLWRKKVTIRQGPPSTTFEESAGRIRTDVVRLPAWGDALPLGHTHSRPRAFGLLDSFNTEVSPKRYWRGPKSQEVGKRENMPHAVHCRHQNHTCIKTGSDERHCKASLTVRDRVTR